MTRLGFSHIDLATKDMAATRDFCERILGLPVVRSDMVELESGGYVEHVFFDCGSGQMIAFAGAEHAPGRFPADLEGKGVSVRGVEDHEGWCRSTYFVDPNDLQMEYCCLARKLTEDDARPQVRFRVSKEGQKLPA
jgi:catechol 2,3-dioxygenase-like lactoylglutathione lyase family enzyme